MAKLLTLLALFAFSLGLAQSYTLDIDGRAAVSQSAITVGGQLYVPLEALTQAGVTATISGNTLSLTLPGAQVTGGANQRESLEGCLGQDLFNGIWRVKLLSVAPLERDGFFGWGLTLELRNGTTQTLQPVFTGVNGTGEGIQLVMADETILPVDPLDVQTLTFASLPQGGGVTHQLKFYYPFGTPQDAMTNPDRLLFEIKPEDFASSMQAAGVAYSTPTPSLRVRLACTED